MSALAKRKEVLAQKKAFPIEDLGWTSAEDLDAVVESCPVVSVVAADQYAQMNIEQTFHQLILCGDLLNAAYSSAGTQPCSKNILATMEQYQSMVNDSFSASQAFVLASVEALKVHKLVIKSFQKGKPELALKQYAKVGALALQMATVADGVATKAESLVVLSSGGLLEAKANQNASAEEQAKIDKLIGEMSAEKAKIEQTREDLQHELDEAREEETKFAEAACQQRDRAFGMQIVGALVQGIGAAAACTPAGAAANASSSVAGALGTAVGAAAAAGNKAADQAVAVADNSGVGGDAVEALKGEKRKAQAEVAKLEAFLQSKSKAVDADTPEGRQAIEEAGENLKKMEAAAEKVGQQLFDLAGQADARAESLEAKEASATARRRLLADQRRSQNAALAKNVEAMKTMAKDKTQVEKTILCLTTTIRTMGKVVTTFKDVKLFWECVSKHCMTLAGLNETIMVVWNGADDDEKEIEGFDLISEQFYESAVGWAALGSVNRKANVAMIAAKKSVDSKMTSLPGPEETEKIIAELCPNMAKALADENKNLEAILN